MKNNQQRYIKYVRQFAEENKCHIWLGGSFLCGTATLYSDVDISAHCNSDYLRRLIYGYGNPVYLSFTHKPLGILIIIYEDGVAVDLEIIKKIDSVNNDFFHTDDIKLYDYSRNEKLCREFSLRDDIHYQISRLFHRSLIKFLSGKEDLGVSIANEIVLFKNYNIFIDKVNYKNSIIDLIKIYNEQYQLPLDYLNILYELIEKLDKGNRP